ncbi:MAG: sulfotransferase domain-containing protein [Pseudomonadota bacterium]
MKTIIICGMQRSGTTALFNIIRLLSQLHGYSLNAAFVDDYDPSIAADIHLIKTHVVPEPLLQKMIAIGRPAPELGVTFISSHRDVRDVVASAMRMGWIEDERVMGHLADVFDRYTKSETFADYNMRYENFKADPIATMLSLAAAIDMPITQEQAQELDQELRALNDLKVPQGHYDPITLLHNNHVGTGDSGDHKQRLTPARIAEIETLYGDWLKDKGYDVPASSSP